MNKSNTPHKRQKVQERTRKKKKKYSKSRKGNLPGRFGHVAVGPAPDPRPSQLINHNDKQAKRKRQEPVLDGHGGRAEDVLYGGNVQPDDGHAEREQDGREEVPVGRVLVEQRRVLQDAQAARSRGHEVEPLHDDEVDEVDGGGLVQLLVVVVRVDAGGDVAEAEPQVGEGDPVALEVPEGHGEGGQRLGDADDGVGVEHELPVDEAVLFDVSGSTEEDIGLGFFIR